MSKHPFFRGAFSYLFEIFFRVWFYSNPANALSLSCTTWSSCAESTAKPLCLNPVGWEKVIVQGELGTKCYRSANELQIPFGWIPASRSEATFDAVICTHTEIITIQVTVAVKDGVKGKGFESLVAIPPKEFQKARRLCHSSSQIAATVGKKNTCGRR